MGNDTDDRVHVDRKRTAIRRYRCSRPIIVALNDAVITTSTSVFDYGCGLGGDVRYLCKQGVPASGWDPFHHPDGAIDAADVVNLGYVLNVVEDPDERKATLLRAFELTRQALVVAVRVDRSLDDACPFGDGLLTSAGTFQKIFTQAEFRSYLEETLERRCHPAGLGIAYVFKNESVEALYLANRAFSRRLEYRTDLIDEFAHNKMAQKFVDLANSLGRLPLREEFPEHDQLIEKFGSAHRLQRLALLRIDEDAFQGSRSQRREDILVFLATLRLQGLRPPPLSSLPPSIRSDIRGIWGSYTAAKAEGEMFLFDLGKPEMVKSAASSLSVGKLVADDFYIHESVEDELPALLRLVVFAGRQIVGSVKYNVLKLRLDGRALSFLRYRDFEEDPHPALRSSVRVYLPRTSYAIRDYTDSDNPPILHRKNALVAPSHPLYEQFGKLTEDEEQAGLLSQPDIGYRSQWLRLLGERGFVVRGHRLVPSGRS